MLTHIFSLKKIDTKFQETNKQWQFQKIVSFKIFTYMKNILNLWLLIHYVCRLVVNYFHNFLTNKVLITHFVTTN